MNTKSRTTSATLAGFKRSAPFGDVHSLSDHLKRNRCAPFGPALRRTFLDLYNVATMKGTLNAAGTLALADCALLHITLYGNP